jgi:hypothetical protein
MEADEVAPSRSPNSRRQRSLWATGAARGRAEAPVRFVGGREEAYGALAARISDRLLPIAATFDEALPVIEMRLGGA